MLDKGIQINYIGNNRHNHAGSGLNRELVSTGRAGGKQAKAWVRDSYYRYPRNCTCLK